MTFAFKSSKISYEKAINKNIHFKCEDELTQFFVKVGSLFTITEATENKDGIVKKGFINCLETVNYEDQEEKEMCLASLGASWNIFNEKDLIFAIIELIPEPDEDNYSINWNTKEFGWFLKKVEKYQIKFKDINNKKNTKFQLAYNLQRSVFLLRDGLTCELINSEALEDFKSKICDIINKEFDSLEDFIIDYLIGVCFFYEGRAIVGPGMERERFEGIKLLIENDYFNKDLNKL